MEEIKARIIQLEDQLNDPEILDKARIEIKLEAYRECLGYLENQPIYKGNLSKVMTVGVGNFDQTISIEHIQRLVKESNNVVVISGHNLPSNETLAEMIEGVRRKHPEYFEELSKPLTLTAPERFESTYFEEKPKGHKRPFKYHK